MSQNGKNIPGTTLLSPWEQPLSLVQDPPTGGKPKVVGIYGISGSGKTYMLNQLKLSLGAELFLFFEGSEMISTLVPGGLEAFKKSADQRKAEWRQLAIDTIGKVCTASGKSGIVTGHLMFWPDEEEEGHMVYTPNDLATFTHILYLDVPVSIVQQRHREDTGRTRPAMTERHLAKWQQAEKNQLSQLCRDHGILFSLLAPSSTSYSSLPSKVSVLLRDFNLHTEKHNLSYAETRLDDMVALQSGRVKTMLVVDADKTLAAEDTGELFWAKFRKTEQPKSADSPLKSLFSSSLGYSYNAFRQATLLNEQATDDKEYEALCQDVASEVTMYPEMVSLLQSVSQQEHVGVCLVSCGLRRVWDIVLEREGFSDTVRVIAGGRIADGLVVTPAVKAAMVVRLRNVHRMYVWAFGDSPLDLEMLKEADQAVVVVGDKSSRSKSMDVALSVAINQGGLQARQVLLPNSVSPRLDPATLPVAEVTEAGLISSILRRRHAFSVFLATDKNAAKLLATRMRDSSVAGPALREAHRRAGAYLATEYLSSVIGVEERGISHVLGHISKGYQLRHEAETTIVAAMRAGEPMASGVNEVIPLAMFVHASGPESIEAHHLQGQHQVLLVDAVINTGKTILELVRAIRKLNPDIRIIIVAGIVQAECISPDTPFYKTLADCGSISIVALRSSDTKFTGSGGTDTGNRLFNTTHLK
ncbi:uracil phosphoribosyltransferase [Diplodia corticola]|uniref:Uracil phosphoribosyltransferase n=1 Tax=Diplodia corticola TaxID=236234 RepID=A0A1J9RB95_9PEZI|nr:uracil phosphoribosyltransferase [Diplodia corticola]OJD37418.1 uracil phosphoribosyltransferase [Diplodia corticola]